VDVKEAPGECVCYMHWFYPFIFYLLLLDKSKATPKSRRRSYGEEPPSIVPEGLSVRKVKQPAGDGSAQSAVSEGFLVVICESFVC
jgi:hypothetical protein